ncbi:MAG: type II toxin-antitoxin system VapC family toxin, partial [Armatimonadetes bacterium]|nr:type II toxin-antitoxin system VapC family toxin [Armatimonadota bacterium]
VEVLPFDTESAILAGRIDGDLWRTGQRVGRADPMIAAQAIVHSLVLVSGNLEHYRRIQTLGYPLQLANWREGRE